MAFKRKNKEQLTDSEKLAQEEAFLASADKTPSELEVVQATEVELDKKGKPFSDDPKAPRNYKLMTARFNKYEIDILDKLSAEFGVDRMNVLRVAYINLAKEKGII